MDKFCNFEGPFSGLKKKKKKCKKKKKPRAKPICARKKCGICHHNHQICPHNYVKGQDGPSPGAPSYQESGLKTV